MDNNQSDQNYPNYPGQNQPGGGQGGNVYEPGQPIQPGQPGQHPGQPQPPGGQPMVKKTNRKIFQITDYIFWLIEGVILLRFILRLIGANTQNGFVTFIYNTTNAFVNIFKGITGEIATGPAAEFEVSALIAMLVIWLIYLAIVKLLQISTS